jgi:hypothetical protein
VKNNRKLYIYVNVCFANDFCLITHLPMQGLAAFIGFEVQEVETFARATPMTLYLSMFTTSVCQFL